MRASFWSHHFFSRGTSESTRKTQKKKEGNTNCNRIEPSKTGYQSTKTPRCSLDLHRVWVLASPVSLLGAALLTWDMGTSFLRTVLTLLPPCSCGTCSDTMNACTSIRSSKRPGTAVVAITRSRCPCGGGCAEDTKEGEQGEGRGEGDVKCGHARREGGKEGNARPHGAKHFKSEYVNNDTSRATKGDAS